MHILYIHQGLLIICDLSKTNARVCGVNLEPLVERSRYRGRKCSGLMAPDILIRDNNYQLLRGHKWDRNEHINSILKTLKRKR